MYEPLQAAANVTERRANQTATVEALFELLFRPVSSNGCTKEGILGPGVCLIRQRQSSAMRDPMGCYQALC